MWKHLIRFAAASVGALTLMPSALWAQAPSDADRWPYGPHMMWWGGGWHAMIFGPLFMLLFLAALIATVVLLVRWLDGARWGAAPANPAPAGRKPLDILKERFARGEINKDEFEERRRVLGE